MKFAVALLATLAVVSPLYAYRLPATGNGALAKELQDFMDVIPLEKIIAVTKAYLAQDKQFQAMLRLVQSNAGRLFVQDVEADPVFKKLLNYIQENGLDIYYLMNKFNESLDLSRVQPRSTMRITGGLVGYLQDISSLVPLEKLSEIYEEKRQHSKQFNEYVKAFMSKDYVKLYLSLHRNVHFKNMEKNAEEIGIEQNLFGESYIIFIVISGVAGKQ